MVFSIVIILLVGLIAYFHFVQGFFSATLSAIIAVLAAVLAVSYDETVVNSLLKGKMADISHAFVLCAIFALTYTLLRFIFDAAIPGNVRVPSTVDKIGAAVMGLVAGVFTTGIFALAVQMLPFGPTISLMGYSRYTTSSDREVFLPSVGNGQMPTSVMHDEVAENSITGDPDSRAKQKTLYLPVDDWLLDTVYHLSDGGSLAGDRTLASVHPDYLQELFGERLGQQDGGRRSALVFQGNDSITLGGVFSADSIAALDGEVKNIRQDFVPPKEVKPDHDHQILVVRVVVHSNATDDEDKIFRFSTGSVHLVSHVARTDGDHNMDYYPVGMMENGAVVLVDKPDDYLFLNLKQGDASFDAVFLVDKDVIIGGKTSNQVAPGTFISVKRFGLLSLDNQPIGPIIPPPGPQLLHSKAYIQDVKIPAAAPVAAAPTPAEAPAAPAAGRAAAPVPAAAEPAKSTATASGVVSWTLPFDIGCKTDNNDDPSVTVAGGTMALKGGNIAMAQINPVNPTELAKGDSQLKELAVPDGYKLVQVSYSTTADAFGWVAQLGAIQVLDSNSNASRANGVIVRLSDKVMLRYDMNHTQFAVPSLSGVPQSTTFLFVVRNGTHLASLQIGSDSTPISVDVP